MTVNSLGLTYGSSSINQNALRRGFKMTANTSGNFTTITKDAGTTATTAFIYTDAATPNLLGSATFTGNNATFNIAYTSGSSYYVMIGTGTNFTFKYMLNATYPINMTDFNVTGDYYMNTPYNQFFTSDTAAASLVSITTSSGGGGATDNPAFLLNFI